MLCLCLCLYLYFVINYVCMHTFTWDTAIPIRFTPNLRHAVSTIMHIHPYSSPLIPFPWLQPKLQWAPQAQRQALRALLKRKTQAPLLILQVLLWGVVVSLRVCLTRWRDWFVDVSISVFEFEYVFSSGSRGNIYCSHVTKFWSHRFPDSHCFGNTRVLFNLHHYTCSCTLLNSLIFISDNSFSKDYNSISKWHLHACVDLHAYLDLIAMYVRACMYVCTKVSKYFYVCIYWCVTTYVCIDIYWNKLYAILVSDRLTFTSSHNNIPNVAMTLMATLSHNRTFN